MLDIGLSCQILSSSLSSRCFLPLLCLGSSFEAIYNVASGPCAGVIKLHWASKLLTTEDGIAEISATRRAQRTVMQLIGLVMANLLIRWIDNVRSKGLLLALYLCLSGVHLVSNWKSLQQVGLDWLNGWRLNAVTQEFLDSIDAVDRGKEVLVSTPMVLSKREPMFFSRRRIKTNTVRVGVSFYQFAQISAESLSDLQYNIEKNQNETDDYMLTAGDDDGRVVVAIAYYQNTSNRCLAKVYLHGCLMRRMLIDIKGNIDQEVVKEAKVVSSEKLKLLWPLFETRMTDLGWRLDKTECFSEGYVLIR